MAKRIFIENCLFYPETGELYSRFEKIKGGPHDGFYFDRKIGEVIWDIPRKLSGSEQTIPGISNKPDSRLERVGNMMLDIDTGDAWFVGNEDDP